jgi:hypothetical protein
MIPKIFVSYNPGVEIEQSTALRLQTLAGLYGAVIHLPDRFGSSKLKDSTKQRIADADLFVMFSTQTLHRQVEEEVAYAFSLDKRVLIFYDKNVGKNLDTSRANVTEEYFDPLLDTSATVMERVARHGGFIKNAAPKQPSPENNVAAALVGIGLGLFLLWALSKKND